MLQALRSPVIRGHHAVVRLGPICGPFAQQSRLDSNLPRIAQPSLWSSIVPKALRRSSRQDSDLPEPVRKGWNPATFFIVMSLLVGSNAIQLISLKTQRLNYKRTTEAKLALLRDVIRRVHSGEEVDVAAELGTGVPEKEKEWEEMIEDLKQQEDLLEKVERKNATKYGRKKVKNEEGRWVENPDYQDQSQAADRKPGFY